jgi:azurin
VQRWILFVLIAYAAAFYIQHLGRVSGENLITAPGLVFAQTTGSALSLVFLSVLISLPFRKQRRFTVRFWSLFIMSFFAIIGAKDSNTKNPLGDNAPPTNGISSPQIPQPTIAKPSHITAADTTEATPSGETKVVIGVVPTVMQYDKKEFSVKAGDKVSILFTNKGCPLQHNLVILKPGTDAKFGPAADKMIVADAIGAMAKAYLPDDAESKASIVAASTRLIGTGQNEILTFTAPAEAGAYPFLCTFPGHRFLMKGVMTVTQ